MKNRKISQNTRYKLVPVAMALILMLSPANPAFSDSKDDPASRVDPFLRIDLAFPGGTVDQFVALLKGIIPEANIIVPEAAKELLIPEMDLMEIEYDNLIEIISSVTANRIQCRFLNDNLLIIEERWSEATQKKLVMYSVAPLLENHSIEDINALLETAYEMAREGCPDFRFHEETSIMMAKVSENQHRIADDIFSMLQPNPTPKADPQELKEVKNELDDYKQKLKTAEMQLNYTDQMEAYAREELQATKAKLQATARELDGVKYYLGKTREELEKANQNKVD